MLSKYVDILKEEYKFKNKGDNKLEGYIKEEINGKEFFNYHISIDLNPILNGRLPYVRELENKIPNTMEYHKYTENNTFCFGIGLYEKFLFNKMKESFVDFIEKQVKGYLFSVLNMDLKGKWAGKEFSHDKNVAKKEAFYYILGFDYKKHELSTFVINIKNRHTKCFCLSNKIYKDCHYKNYLDKEKYIGLKELKKSIIEAFPELGLFLKEELLKA